MSKIIDPNGFTSAIDFVMRPLKSNAIWTVIERTEPVDYDGTVHFCYHDDGVELISNETGSLLDTIYFYVRGCDETDQLYRPFTAALPYPLERDMIGYDIIMKLGRPRKIGEARDFPGLGFQRPSIKYYPRDGVQLMIEFDGERIWRVNVGKAFY